MGRTGEPVPPRSFSGRQTKPNSRTPSAASSSRNSDSMMWMPDCTIRIVWPGQRAELRVVLVRDVPGDVVGADGHRVMGRQPARGVRGHAAGAQVRGAVGPQRAGAEPDQHRVAAAQLDALRGRLEIRAVTRSPAPEHVQQHAAADHRRDGVDPQRGEAHRRLQAPA